jgi:hypothetical protein
MSDNSVSSFHSLDVRESLLVPDINIEWIINARVNEGFTVVQIQKMDNFYGYSLELQWMYNITIIYTLQPDKKRSKFVSYIF